MSHDFLDMQISEEDELDRNCVDGYNKFATSFKVLEHIGICCGINYYKKVTNAEWINLSEHRQLSDDIMSKISDEVGEAENKLLNDIEINDEMLANFLTADQENQITKTDSENEDYVLIDPNVEIKQPEFYSDNRPSIYKLPIDSYLKVTQKIHSYADKISSQLPKINVDSIQKKLKNKLISKPKKLGELAKKTKTNLAMISSKFQV